MKGIEKLIELARGFLKIRHFAKLLDLCRGTYSHGGLSLLLTPSDLKPEIYIQSEK